MDVCLRGEFDVARVYHDELAAAFHSGANLHAQDRVCLLRVGAHEQDGVSLLCDVVDGVGHCA